MHESSFQIQITDEQNKSALVKRTCNLSLILFLLNDDTYPVLKHPEQIFIIFIFDKLY